MRDCSYLPEALSLTINLFRNQKNLTKTSLADLSALERRYLHEIDTCQKRPTMNAIYCICEGLNIPPIQFFTKLEEIRLRMIEERRPVRRSAS